MQIEINIDGPFRKIINKQVSFVFTLWILVIISALAIVFIKHNNRIFHASLQKLESRRNILQIEWSKLVLEQSTWTTDSRVEKIARNELNMGLPDKSIVIGP